MVFLRARTIGAGSSRSTTIGIWQKPDPISTSTRRDAFGAAAVGPTLTGAAADITQARMTEPSVPSSVPAPHALRWPGLHLVARGVERFAYVLDSALPIPGTRFRIGLDPILGLVFPGVGDAAGGVLSLGVLFLALQYRVPLWVLTRMVVNIGLDAAVGGVPLLGDVFDFGFKANQRNFDMLRQHQLRELAAPLPKRYWLYAGLLVLLATASLLLPLLLVAYLLHRLFGSGG